MRAKAAVEQGAFKVEGVETKPHRRNPQPPFTTSTLQQEAARKLGFSASQAMRVAQSLYEAGAITYMRTDGVQMDHSAISAARAAIADRFSGHYVPEKPRHYETKAKNAQEAHEAIRPTDFTKDRFGSGDEARLYDLIFKRAMASQMASAALERTTVTLRDGTGRNELRATGTVVKFPGFLAVYEEGRDNKGEDDEEAGLLPFMKAGDMPAKKDVSAEQHFTQPPPRFSEASLVKRLEELGIGRPSTYASTIQVIKDRNYVRTEKNRFFAEESGRLLTSFLERFFDRYVAYDFTAGMEDQLDNVSGGREEWKVLLANFWRDFKPKSDEVMEKKPSEVTEALDEFLSDYLFPPKADGSDARLCPKCEQGRLSLRGGRYGAFIACSNYPECKFTRKFAQPGGATDGAGDDESLGKDPETDLDIVRRTGRFGPYIQLGEGKEAKRASIPKDIDELNLEWAIKLLSLPRTVGTHPESEKPITASIGRYGPYLAHDGKYAKLRSTAEVFDTGMNAAVSMLADAANRGGASRTKAEPLKVFGAHPVSGGEMKLMEGRYGPYVSDGTTNATLPRDMKPEDLTEEQAVTLITEKAAKGPVKGKKKAPAKKAAAKKPAAKKAPAKAAAAKKAPAKKAVKAEAAE
jgi:DNA topoisomerase-1